MAGAISGISVQVTGSRIDEVAGKKSVVFLVTTKASLGAGAGFTTMLAEKSFQDFVAFRAVLKEAAGARWAEGKADGMRNVTNYIHKAAIVPFSLTEMKHAQILDGAFFTCAGGLARPQVPKLPKKTLRANFDPVFLEGRREGLDKFIQGAFEAAAADEAGNMLELLRGFVYSDTPIPVEGTPTPSSTATAVSTAAADPAFQRRLSGTSSSVKIDGKAIARALSIALPPEETPDPLLPETPTHPGVVPEFKLEPDGSFFFGPSPNDIDVDADLPMESATSSRGLQLTDGVELEADSSSDQPSLGTKGRGQLDAKSGEMPKDRPKSWADDVPSEAAAEAADAEDDAVFGFVQDHDDIAEALVMAAGVSDGMAATVAPASETLVTASEPARFRPELWPIARFAERNFNDPAVVHPVNKRRSLANFTKKAVVLSRTDLTVYSATAVQIKAPLTKIKDPENVDLAITLYFDQHRLVHDMVTQEAAAVRIQSAMLYCLDRVELRDEVFCHLIRQTNENPDIEARLRGWHLLCICCAMFPPGSELVDYLKAYIMRNEQDEHVGKYAANALRLFERCQTFGPRKKGICRAEIDALRTLQPIIVRFYFLDGRAEEIGLNPSHHIRDVVKEVAARVLIKDPVGWALFETTPEKEVHIPEQTVTGDLLFEWELVARSGTGGGEPKFVFRKRLFMNPRRVPTNTSEIRLLFAQAAHYVVRADEYMVSESTALKLAGLQAQALYGDPEGRSLNYDIPGMIPWRLLSEEPVKSKGEWIETVKRAHGRYGAGKTEMVAKTEYLTTAAAFPLYGGTFFDVVYKGVWKFPNRVCLWVGDSGFKLVSTVDRSILAEYSYQQLQNVEINNREDTVVFNMHADALSSNGRFSFMCLQRDTVAKLVVAYSPTHKNWKRISSVDAIVPAKGITPKLTDSAAALPKSSSGFLLTAVTAARNNLALVPAMLKRPVQLRRAGRSGSGAGGNTGKNRTSMSFLTKFRRKSAMSPTGAASAASAAGLSKDQSWKRVSMFSFAKGLRRKSSTGSDTLSGDSAHGSPSASPDAGESKKKSNRFSRSFTRGSMSAAPRASRPVSVLTPISPTGAVVDEDGAVGTLNSAYPPSYWEQTDQKIFQSLTEMHPFSAEQVALQTFNAILVHAGILPPHGSECAFIEGYVDDPMHASLVHNVIGACLEKENVCNEVYVQLIKQTTAATGDSQNGASSGGEPGLTQSSEATLSRSKLTLQSWRFLALILGIVVPRQRELVMLLKAHLAFNAAEGATTEDRLYASFCTECMARTRANRNRKYPPSHLEVLHVREMQKIKVPFWLMGGETIVLEIDAATTTAEAVAALKAELKLPDGLLGYSIFEVFDSLERNMLQHEKVADAISKWTAYAKNVRAKHEVQLTFKKRLFIGPALVPEHPLEFNLLHLQAAAAIVSDTFPVNRSEACKLVALRAQALHGDFDGTAAETDKPDRDCDDDDDEDVSSDEDNEEGQQPPAITVGARKSALLAASEHFFDGDDGASDTNDELVSVSQTISEATSIDVESNCTAPVQNRKLLLTEMQKAAYNKLIVSCLPPHLTAVVTPEEVAGWHTKLRGKSASECDTLTLKFAMGWKLYGATVFNVTQSFTRTLKKQLWLAVDENGIHIMNRRSKDPLISYPYRNIVNYSPSLRNLVIATESHRQGTKYIFDTNEASQIAHLIKDYTNIILKRTTTASPERVGKAAALAPVREEPDIASPSRVAAKLSNM